MGGESATTSLADVIREISCSRIVIQAGILTALSQSIMVPLMRTTVTLEPDVARLLDDHARRNRKSFKETLNTAVRLGLGRASTVSNEEFTLNAQPMQLRTGVDAGRFNTLLDELDAEVFVEKARMDHRKNPLS